MSRELARIGGGSVKFLLLQSCPPCKQPCFGNRMGDPKRNIPFTNADLVMAFQIQPATFSDLDCLAEVIVSAHVKDEMLPIMMGKVPHHEQVEWYADSLRKVWEEDEEARYYKAIETGTQ